MNDAGQSIQPSAWTPHDQPDYDQTLKAGCEIVINCRRNATSQDRLKFITDPRDIHKRL
jgi:hypothetical protein